jgi:hypothetical protein
MEGHDLVIAATLLAALRKDGCVVTANGDNLNIKGPVSDNRMAMVNSCKPELLAVLAVEGAMNGSSPIPEPEPSTQSFPTAAQVDAFTNRVAASLAERTPPTPTSGPAPLPRDSLLALASRRTGTWVATAEWLAWLGQKNAAARDGRPFNEPPPPWVQR